MKSIYITGSSGFIGTNFKNVFNNKYSIINYIRGQKIDIQTDIVLHLAGKAHDTKNKNDLKAYYTSNTIFTDEIFNNFLASNAKIFIYISSVKAVVDYTNDILVEENFPMPYSEYGISKLLSEFNILTKCNNLSKKVFILRPAMIHGENNKGNLNTLYKFLKLGLPWPLLAFENNRSFCCIDNLFFIIKELIEREDIENGIYNICDDEAISTNELVEIIYTVLRKKSNKMTINKKIIFFFAKIGDLFMLPFNSDKLTKLTNNFVVSNNKIKLAIGKNLPYSTRDGLIKTLSNFH
jgi:nucleoside-diphosphate-sugar epimerase